MHASFAAYRDALNRTLRAGQAGEASHYPSLKAFLEALRPDAEATSEPRRVAVGAPDFQLTAGPLILGHVECKDLAAPLDPVERGEQMSRYLALPAAARRLKQYVRWPSVSGRNLLGRWRITWH